MRLLQAIWDPSGTLLIWGEDASRVTFANPAEVTGNSHPFCCSFSQLRSDLESFGCESVSPRQCTLFLPTAANIASASAPCASPRLPVPGALDTPPERLDRWVVEAAALTGYEALSFLSSVPERLPEGLRFDFSLEFWREATKLLLESLTRGHFLPGVRQDIAGAHAFWHPLALGDEYQACFDTLSRAMPTICRSLVPERTGSESPLSDSGNSASDHEPPEAVPLLESFLATGTDVLVKTFLSRHDFLSFIPPEETVRRPRVIVSWLRGLSGREAQLEGSDFEHVKLEQALRTWSGKLLKPPVLPPLATYFRLTPPSAQDSAQSWTVTFGLIVRTDRQILVPAESIWNEDTGVLEANGYSAEQLEDSLLRSLGRALHKFPALRNGLLEQFPAKVSLTLREAYQFLKEQAPLLEREGFSVFLPEWWQSSEAKLGLHVSIRPAEKTVATHGGASFLSTDQLLDCSWEVSLGNQRLSPEEFRKLIREHIPLLEVDGQWIEIHPKRLEKTLKFLEEHENSRRLTLLEALRAASGVDHDAEILPVRSFAAEGWLSRLFDSSTPSTEPLHESTLFKGTLRHYQRDGLTWLVYLSQLGLGGCLADDMGLGKTIQLLALLLREREEGSDARPTLLIVPMSILANWESETERFAPLLKLYLHHGAQRLAGKDFISRAVAVDAVITTYSLAFRDEHLLQGVPWKRIVLDEAQNIKNLEAKQTQAVRRLARKLPGSANGGQNTHRLALTGTPLENRLEELWSIFDFLNPGLLGSLEDFRKRFVLPIERYRDKEASERLARLIQPFLLRRLKSDPAIIDDLPEKIEMEVLAPLSEEQGSLYRMVLNQMLPQVDAAAGIHRKGLVLATITKLKQVCNHPSLLLKDGLPLGQRSGKLSAVEEILEVVLAEGDRVLIFTQFAQMGHLLKPHLQERFDTEVLFLHGGLSKLARDKLVAHFTEPMGPRIFILSLKAGGFGLNLTGANQVIHFDQWWNPAVEEQATDRAYRIGQRRNVQVRKLICKGTLEEKIQTLVEHKRHLANQIVGSTKSLITELSTDELRDLLQLSGPSSHSEDYQYDVE